MEYEVEWMRKSLLYVPELYIGLLQSGRNWVAILRKVVCGEVLLTYVEAPPAFEVDGTSVSEVNDVNCGYIARLFPIAYVCNFRFASLFLSLISGSFGLFSFSFLLGSCHLFGTIYIGGFQKHVIFRG